MRLRNLVLSLGMVLVLDVYGAAGEPISCPNSFEPDNSSWVLTARVSASGVGEYRNLSEGKMFMRELFYQPNNTQNFAMRKPNGCMGAIFTLYSYLTGKEERVLMVMGDSTRMIARAKGEDGTWHQGNGFFTDFKRENEITVRIFQNEVLIFERTF